MSDPLEPILAEYRALAREGRAPDVERFLALHPGLDEHARRRLRALGETPHSDARELAPPGGGRGGGSGPGSGGGPGSASDSAGARAGAAQSASLLAQLRGEAPRGTRYRVIGEIARGGMGVVLEVWDDELRRTLAMKTVLARELGALDGAGPSDARALARFLEEAQITGQLEHPGIVPVHEVGLGPDGRAYFTMRRVQGRDLREVFADVRAGRDGWSLTRALGVILKICEAMSYAHAKGVLHRDLKPGNVMVGAFGEVYVMDWGLARVLGRGAQPPPAGPVERAPRESGAAVRTERHERRGESPDSPILTHDGEVVGTPSFMPPEQALGQLDRLGPHSDVYSVGAMLYELICGELPYAPRGAAVTHKAVLDGLRAGPPTPLERLAPATPPELVAICERAMGREIASRYATMAELGDDLRAFLENRVVRAHRTGTWAETTKWVRRNRGLAASLAATLVCAVAGVLGFGVQANEARANARSAREREYVANLRAAEASLQANQSSEASRRLRQCDESRKADWEWRHFALAADTSLGARRDLPQRVNAIAVDLDATRIYAGLHGGSVGAWDFARDTWTPLIGGIPDVYAIAVSPEGGWLAVGAHAGFLRLYRTDDPRREIELEGHTRGLLSLSFSRDGRLLASSADDNSVRIWDLDRFECAAVLDGHTAFVKSVAFLPDGEHVVSGAADETVRVWHWRSGTARILRGHTDTIRSVACSPGGERIVSGGDDSTARLWDARTGELECELRGHAAAVLSVKFDPRGERVVTASADRSVRVWDAWSGRLETLHRGHDDRVTSLAFLRGGDELVSGSHDRSLRTWSIATSDVTVLRGHDSKVLGVRFDESGGRLVSAGADCTVRLWDGHGGAPITTLHGRSISGQASLVACRGAVVLWRRRTHLEDRLHVSGPAPQPDRECELPPRARQVVASDDGQWIAILGDDQRVRCWRGDAAGGLERLEAASFRAPPTFEFELGAEGTTMGFDPRSRWLAATGDRRLVVWDLRAGEPHFVAEPGARIGWDALAFEPRGERLLLANGDTIHVWDLARRVHAGELRAHTAEVTGLAFDPGGKRFASASRDLTVRIWNAETLESAAVLRGHTDAVRGVAWSPDGERLASCSDDQTIRIWHTAGVAERVAAGDARAWLRQASERRLEELGSRLRSTASVLAELEANQQLPAELRELCQELARAEGDDPAWLGELAWDIVRSPRASPQAFRRALRLAQRALLLAPEDSRALLLVGAAQFRLGDHRAALGALERSVRAAPHEPDRWPFLAMVHARLGNLEEATQHLTRARELMKLYKRAPKDSRIYEGDFWEDDYDLRDLVEEAARHVAALAR